MPIDRLIASRRPDVLLDNLSGGISLTDDIITEAGVAITTEAGNPLITE